MYYSGEMKLTYKHDSSFMKNAFFFFNAFVLNVFACSHQLCLRSSDNVLSAPNMLIDKVEFVMQTRG